MRTYTRLALLPISALTLALVACEQETATNDADRTAPPITEDRTTNPGTPDAAPPTTPGAGAPGAESPGADDAQGVDPTVEQEVSAFQDRMSRELDELSREIETIEDRAAELSAQARDRYDAALAELRDRRDSLEERIEQIEAGSRARWAEMRATLEAEWVDMTRIIADVQREIDNDPN